MVMYPLKFDPIYKEKIWGGPEFNSFRKSVPQLDIGESWEISCHPEGISTVSNGEFKGMKLDELLRTRSEEILGTNFKKAGLQLLVKIISSKDKLSVQVHPDDKYAEKHENQNGKNEIWYVMDAKDDAELVLGFKDCDRKKLELALKEGGVEEYLNTVSIKKGDVYFVKAGLVHAICAGSLIVEIQQSSDLTYRLYDYGRKRQMHIEKALDVIDYKLKSPLLSGRTGKHSGYLLTRYIKTGYFTLEKMKIETAYEGKTDGRRYHIFVCLNGTGGIIYGGNLKESIGMGESVLIPATLGEFRIEGELELLRTFI
jgi:mannose-6-phosphate isomerase